MKKIIDVIFILLITFAASWGQVKPIPFSAAMLKDKQGYKKEIGRQVTKSNTQAALAKEIEKLEFDSGNEIRKIIAVQKGSNLSLAITPSITFNGKVERIEEISKDIKKIVVKDPADTSYELQIMLYYTLDGTFEAFSARIVNADLQRDTLLYPITWIIRPTYMNSKINPEWSLVSTSSIFYID